MVVLQQMTKDRYTKMAPEYLVQTFKKNQFYRLVIIKHTFYEAVLIHILCCDVLQKRQFELMEHMTDTTVN